MNTDTDSARQKSSAHSRFVAPNAQRFFSVISTPVGKMLLVSDGSSLVELHLPANAPFEKTIGGYTRDNRMLHPVAEQIAAYFAGELRVFTVTLAPAGTDFQLSVWNALCDVAYGATATYGDIAKAVGRPKAPRAVGMANHVNPIALIVPCHRVIGANGSLTGYGGGLDLKSALLSHESSVLAGARPKWSRRSRPKVKTES